MKKIYLFLVMCCLSVAGYAQTAASYGLTATSGTYASISGTGTAITSGGMISDNGATTSIPIGFNFVYCGTTYSAASASANGWFSLANSALGTAPSQTNASGSLSSIAGGVGLLMPVWADLYGTGQTAYYQTTGTTGSRIFTIEWKNWSVCCAAGLATLNFQVKLYEGTNTIEYWYGANAGTVPTTATIGVANSTFDFQTLPAGTSTFANTSFNATCSPPANGTILRWCAPAPAISGGTTAFCQGTTTTLTNTLAGGTWSSSAPTIATVGSSSGIVTGVSGGTAIISYTPACGPSATKTVTVTATPTTFTITGGGAYCAGASGVLIGLNGSTSGVTYTLYNAATAVGTVSGTGSAISFGLQTVSGTSYTVTASSGTCSATMLGSTSVSVNPLPTQFTTTGGGPYCSGGTGSVVGLSSSTIGVNYQLFYGATPIGSSFVGTSGALNFGPQTGTASGYTVVGTNASTLCSSVMSGTVNVTTSPLPAQYSVTGTGGYCLGGSGLAVGLSGSVSGTNYQLFLSGVSASSVFAGTGSAINFGNETSPGNYTVTATIPATGCSAAMSGVAAVTVNPLPTPFTILVSSTGSNPAGAYCAGGTGQTISLGGSQAGVNYQLYIGSTATGSPVAGTGTSISFGLQTIVGSYTVVATNATTACVNNMTGSVSISTIPLPAAFAITGGGNYCTGGTGVLVGLGSSTSGVNYSLFNSGTLLGAASGTGGAVSFGLQLLAGAYNVTANSPSTGCSANMSGTVTVSINPNPAVFAVSNVGTGAYCAGGTGVAIKLSGSESGVNYQLYRGGSTLDTTISGTGSTFNFNNRLSAGSYTILAVNATTTCTTNMSGSALITINPLPTVYTLTGGGGYCAGTGGVNIGLSSSNTGINYQLFSSASGAGSVVAGTGSPLPFGLFTAASARDSVVATNPLTSCSAIMSGNVAVSINALPTQYSLTGTASYCFGGAGVSLTLSLSQTGTNYQLYNGTSLVGAPVAGTGSSLTFSGVMAAGSYTVAAVNTTTGCTNNMLGSAVVTVIPLPAVYSVTGGGAFCSGTGGEHVGLSSSSTGVTYQLYNSGVISGAAMTGSSSPIDFGMITTPGSYTVVATTVIGSCQSNMSGAATVSVNPLPSTAYTITQSAPGYCAGGTGVSLGLSSSAIGINYQLFKGATPMGVPMAGSGASLNFGLETLAGTYTITGSNPTTGCFATMTGTATIAISALPSVYAVSGGGSYCPGTTGVPVGVINSDNGINYQLYNGLSMVGGPVAGVSGSPVTFGLQTTPGIYTVVATNTTSSCASNMSSSATVAIYPLPVVYNISGGGSYCASGSGVSVGLTGSNIGVNYQLMNISFPVGTPVSGTGLPISFGLQSATGAYTIVATNSATTCSNTMNGTATVSVNPLPTAVNVTGGGNYCSGASGLAVGIDGSSVGTNYQLVLGGSTPVGTLVAGTGAALSFGLQTAPGIYTVVATNTATTCTNTMTGSATIAINSLPGTFAVTGSATSFCAGSTGPTISIGGSSSAATYQLMNGTTMVGASVAGTGSGLTFGPVTTAGTYSVMATNTANTCSAMMTGTVAVSVNPVPNAYITSGGGAYCSGSAGVHVMLSGSNSGINYQMMTGGTLVTPILAGTGMALDFGLVTSAGSYTIQATNTATGCINSMTDTVNVSINPLPAIHTVVSTSSSFCAGGAGVAVSIDGSDSGINYQLYNGSTAVGTAQAGTGAAIAFGYITFPGSYTIVATNATTSCRVNMAPGVTVTINSLPNVYAVTGGGQYCAGGAGVHIGLAGSTAGISYTLYNDTSVSGVAVIGTGGAVDFGVRTASGTYTVVATNTLTTCVNNMSGSAVVVVNPLPTTFTITGGGAYCAGGTGSVIGLTGSTLGVSYQLMNGTTMAGAAVLGTGIAISFGPQTMAGAYSVTGTSTITGCSNNMTGGATVSINTLPSTYSVTGGGNYCPGGIGVNVGLSNSTTGVSYRLYNGTTPMGVVMAGVTGAPVNFGLQTAAGSYTVIATSDATGCTNTMSGSATVVINPLPTAYAVSGGGGYCVGGAGVAVGLSNTSISVNYTLYDGTTTVTTLAGTGGPINFGMQTLAGTYTVLGTNATTSCTSYMMDSVMVTVNPIVVPTVAIAISGGNDTICSGTFTTFTASGTGGGSSAGYVWTVNGGTAATGSSYGYTPSNGDVVSVVLNSSEACAMPAAASTSVVMTVDTKEVPYVSVSANPGTEVCQGTVVNYTATPSYGGATPTYTWFNASGVNMGTGANFSYTPANGDIVYVVMASDYRCRLADNASSAHINMIVDVPTVPVVTITALPGNNVSFGQEVTLNATVFNGGSAPTFQWLINGVPFAGATNSSFISSSFLNMDSVTCQVTSSGGCAGLLGFNSVILHIANVGVQPVSLSGSDVALIPNPNNGQFTVKGTLGTNTDDVVSLDVVNMLGQVVFTQQVTAHSGVLNEHIQLTGNLANGMYLLNLRSGTENKVFHFVIEQ